MSGILNLNQPTNMTPKTDVLKALNQLISLVAGKEAATATNHLAEDPDARLNEITATAAQDLIKHTTSGDIRSLKQAQRKLESLASLRTLTTCLIKEVEWD